MITSQKEKLLKDGENFINYHLVPYLKLNYPHLIPKISIGISGSLIYGEVDDNSDLDIDIIIDDKELDYSFFSNLEEDIKKIIDRTLYEKIDISVITLSNLGVFDKDNKDINFKLLEGGYILDKIKIIYSQSNSIIKIRDDLRRNFFGNFENKLRYLIYFWVNSSINFVSNIKPLLKRKDYLSFDSLFYENLINLVKFVYILNNEFIPPKKWFIRGIKKLPLLGKTLFEYIEKINSETSREERVYLFEELLITISQEIEKRVNIKIERGDSDKELKDFFEKIGVLVGGFVKGEYLKGNNKITEFRKNSNKKVRYKRVPRNGFIYLIPKEKEEESFYPYEYLHFSYFVRSLGFYDEKTQTIKFTPFLSKFYREIKKIEEENLIKEIEKERRHLKEIEEENLYLDFENDKKKTLNKFKNLLFRFSLSPILLFSLIFIPIRINRVFIPNSNILLPSLSVFSQQPDFPKVSSPNPSWYILENQPREALIIEYEKKDIRVYIGKKEAKINDTPFELDAPPYIKDGRTLVPLRFIAEGLGAEVLWDPNEKKVTLKFEGNTIELWIGKKQAKVNGMDYTLDVPPEITKGRTFVPIRFIGENFGSTVSWNPSLKEVSIIKEREIKRIDENSDVDSDGVLFKDEKTLGTNPNDKYTVYNTLTDKELFELKQKYPSLNIFSPYPDNITKLTLPEKVKFNLNPTIAYNFDSKINDEIVIKYALNRNENIKTKEEIENLWSDFNKKYSSFIEPLKDNLNLETIKIIDRVGDLTLKFINLKLNEKLKKEIDKEFIKRVIEEIDEFKELSPLISSFPQDFINQNRDFFDEIKNSSLEFISEILTKFPTLTIEKQIELNNLYPELDFSKLDTFENPDKVSYLSLEEKIKYNINPLNPYNFDNILNDKKAIEYAKIKNLSQTKEDILKAIKTITDSYGEKLGTALKELLNEDKITPLELDGEGQFAKSQIENMFNLRAYKTKGDGTPITLEDLTTKERYKTLIYLNKKFGREEINILLSQSPTLQKYANENKIEEFKELINTLYQATNSVEPSLNKKVKETNTFTKYTNQLGLYNYNSGELAIKLWLESNNELKEEIKKHPKTTLAVIGVFGPISSAPESQNEKIFNQVLNYAKEHFAYHIETEKILEEIANKEKDNDLRRPLENFDWITLQFIFPNQSWTNAENVEKLQSFEEKLKHTFNYIEDLKIIRENSIKNFHDVKVQSHPEIVLDFLSNYIGSASIDYVINDYTGLAKKGYGTPWGETYTKKIKEWPTGWPTTTDLEIAKKVSYLFAKGKEKISDDEKILTDSLKGWPQVERIINMALNFPTMEVRNRGPPSTLPQDNTNFLEVYSFENIGGFEHPTYLRAVRLEKREIVRVSTSDNIAKIIIPYCHNHEQPFDKIYSSIKFNLYGIPRPYMIGRIIEKLLE